MLIKTDGYVMSPHVIYNISQWLYFRQCVKKYMHLYHYLGMMMAVMTSLCVYSSTNLFRFQRSKIQEMYQERKEMCLQHTLSNSNRNKCRRTTYVHNVHMMLYCIFKVVLHKKNTYAICKNHVMVFPPRTRRFPKLAYMFSRGKSSDFLGA